METIYFRFRGSAPLLVQSDRLVNPLDPLTIRLKELTGKKKKTETDHRAIAAVEYEAQLHYDEKLGPIMPGLNVDAAVVAGAKLTKRGMDVKRGFMTVDDKISIEYDGPRDLKALFADSRFVDCRSVVINQKRTMRTRPIFRDWQLKFEAAYDPDIFNRKDLIACVEAAGRYAGIGTYRPRFGRFIAEVL